MLTPFMGRPKPIKAIFTVLPHHVYLTFYLTRHATCIHLPIPRHQGSRVILSNVHGKKNHLKWVHTKWLSHRQTSCETQGETALWNGQTSPTENDVSRGFKHSFPKPLRHNDLQHRMEQNFTVGVGGFAARSTLHIHSTRLSRFSEQYEYRTTHHSRAETPTL